jgi:two-component system LytT family sensor kinase
VASAVTNKAPEIATRRVPKTTGLYWTCQAIGWSGYLAYVLVGYIVFNKDHQVGDIVSIVLFCTIVPIVMTHGLRRWMYLHRWDELGEWRRKVRQFPAAVVLAVIITVAVGLANGLAHERVWIPTDGMFWMLLAYWWAFGFWLWFYELAHQRRRRNELELIARDSQLRSLRAQLNPHFMFNSLNSVRSLIAENPQGAVSMVTGLSEILRYSLTADRKHTVPLADEIRVIDEYVGVERVRFEDRLHVERAIDPRALNVPVPPMIVQTLVENAVKHGISSLPNGGIVRLDVQLRSNRLGIVIRNTGRFKRAMDGEGFGLQNASERLRLLYGDRASLTVREETNGDGEYTVAELILPIEPVP